MSDQLHVPASLTLKKEPQLPTGYEAGWDPEPVWKRWQREVPAPAWNWTPVVQPVARSLYWLSCSSPFSGNGVYENIFFCSEQELGPVNIFWRLNVDLFPAGAGNFSLHHRVQNGSSAHPTFYPKGTRGSFPGGKAAGAWSWPLTSN
jgi:hypothetical protein